ncbi:hypothetical protein [Salegentibacter sediminis]|uniref:hypothetical protein n=1 Tax=Salegentibacter sediminis TaxID=1930251 RepID=UPI0018E33A1F|nr:hypothetical protein [Salegentibacter sediminis]
MSFRRRRNLILLRRRAEMTFTAGSGLSIPKQKDCHGSILLPVKCFLAMTSFNRTELIERHSELDSGSHNRSEILRVNKEGQIFENKLTQSPQQNRMRSRIESGMTEV